MTPSRAAALSHVRFALLFKRRWAYLRYLHAREALRLVDPASSVLVIGAGAALAEVALALEFPAMRFHLTDHAAASHSTDGARKLIDRFEIETISFGERDILAPVEEPVCDVVYSVEVLEHIQEDDRAAAAMRALARRFVFCLVPFADDRTNADPVRRAKLLETHEHQVAGYDAKRLIDLFANPVAMRGCYWADGGRLLRDRLTAMDVNAMREVRAELEAMAESDVRSILPVTPREAAGIWTLARVHG